LEVRRELIPARALTLPLQRVEIEERLEPALRSSRTHLRHTLLEIDRISGFIRLYRILVAFVSIRDADGWMIKRRFLVSYPLIAQSK
jgi:hypothetical protein